MKYTIAILCAVLLCGCNQPASTEPTASSGVSRKIVKIKTDASGNSIEQRLVAMRLERDNQAGTFKYVYVINAYTGNVMYQSMAVGKVVSSAKRLSPGTVAASVGNGSNGYYGYGIPVNIGGQDHHTSETLSDDGTYGSSSPYLYWFDPFGNYHQVYASSVYLHVSSNPLVIRNSVLTMEVDQAKASEPIKASAEIEAIRKDFK